MTTISSTSSTIRLPLGDAAFGRRMMFKPVGHRRC